MYYSFPDVVGVLSEFSFVLKKIDPKLSKNGTKIDLKDMLLNTIGNYKGFQITMLNLH